MDHRLPYHGCITGADFFDFKGGYHSIPDGCTPWGISENRYNRFIGDRMGSLRLIYEDGTTDEIPLIFGYTLWFKSVWQEGCMPFQTEDADPALVSCLRAALYLKGAYEGEDFCLLRVSARRGKALLSAEIVANPEKEGIPVFLQFTERGDGADPFFLNHTVDPADPYPPAVRKNIDRINEALLTREEDAAKAPVFEYPEAADGPRIRFTGSYFQEIANGVIYHNFKNLTARIGPDGFFHTSYKGAPSWRYDGFGPWIPHADSYYDKIYSRDAGRALMTLNSFGENKKVQRSLLLANRLMRYFPERGMRIRGKQIPGHYTVVLNEPMLYSEVLRHKGWPTRYTEERFGADCNNLGNQETDGHGLMMMANVCAWENAEDRESYFLQNKESILEGAAWILWCLDHPDVSFAQNGLLYGETEGGMNEYTLYCNVPCCLGLYGYSKIAAAHGLAQEANAWKDAAARLYRAIINGFSVRNEKWDLARAGFQHDPVAVMLSDRYGYDRRDFPEEWRRLTTATYEDDLCRYRGIPVDGKGGIGYNTAMMTQSALLQDNTADFTKLAEDLCKICYAPRLPEPYLVPEGISYSERLRAIRRQGDLGNLVQQAEVLKAFLLMAGISPYRNPILKIMPRLPKGWNLDIRDFTVQNRNVKIDVAASYPLQGRQKIEIRTQRPLSSQVLVRFGPFERPDGIAAELNGNRMDGMPYRSGDAYWMDATVFL